LDIIERIYNYFKKLYARRKCLTFLLAYCYDIEL